MGEKMAKGGIRAWYWIVVLGFGLGVARHLPAQETQDITGSKLQLKNPGSSGRKAVLIAKDPSIVAGPSGGEQDPTAATPLGGGGSIHIVGPNSDMAVTLPAEQWHENGGNYFFSYNGPDSCRTIKVKSGNQIKAVCKYASMTFDVTAGTAPVSIALATGAVPRIYCTTFGGTIIKDGSDGVKFKALGPSTPGGCPCPIFLSSIGGRDAMSSPDDLQFPLDVAVKTDSEIIVIDGGSRVQRRTLNGSLLGMWGTTGSGDGDFLGPIGVAADAGGFVYISELGNHRVQKFTGTGTFVTKWGTLGSAAGEFNQPRGMAIDASGNVYVVDSNNNRIQKFDSNGAFIAQWGSLGSGDGDFTGPNDIAVDAAGHVYVSDATRVQKFTNTGTFLGKWGSAGSADGEFQGTPYLAVAPNGDVYASDPGNDRVQKFSPDGTFLGKYGSSGSAHLRFNNPAGIDVDGNGILYVVDEFNHRVKRYTPFAPCPY